MEPRQAPLTWIDGQPRSAVFGDVYYSLEDGLAESRAVFLAGCGLPQRWAGRARFTVAELGFGTGLNIAALLDLWARTGPEGGLLQIFSIEAFPIAREDAERALSAWPQIAPAARALLDRWPTARRGWRRIDLPAFGAVLDLAIGDVAEMLPQWRGKADAWLLDGFSPAANPAMWTDEVLSMVGRASATGARAATFTVAGQVRRGLEAVGFTVEKRPGYGRKRQRLEATLPGLARRETHPTIAVVGAGIAGAALARAFHRLGADPILFDAGEAGGSHNPAALVMPALDAGGGARAALYAQSFGRAVDLYRQTSGAVIATGAVQLEATPRDNARFDAVAGQDIFDAGQLHRLTAADAAQRLGEAEAPAGLAFEDALVVDPKAVLAAWAPTIRPGRVLDYAREKHAWRLTLEGGEDLVVDILVLATGWSKLAAPAPLSPVRGQASWAALGAPPVASAAGAYAIPTRDGVLFGATHDRGDERTDIRPADNARNLADLAEHRAGLAARLAGATLQARAAIRAATPDRMPLAGEIDNGLHILSGLGSRGFTTAPLLAEHVAARALGLGSPLPSSLAALVDPRRFLEG